MINGWKYFTFWDGSAVHKFPLLFPLMGHKNKGNHGGLVWVLCIPCFDSYTFTNFVLQHNITIGLYLNFWNWKYLNFITRWWRKEDHEFMLLNFVFIWAQILPLLSTRLSSEVTILLSWKIMNNTVTKSFIIRNTQTIQEFCLFFYNTEFLQIIQGFLAHATTG